MSEETSLPNYLSFQLLDDVLFVENEERHATVAQSSISRIGPLVEYVLGNRLEASAFLARRNTEEAGMLASVLDIQSVSKSSRSTSMSPQEIEFFRIPRTCSDFENPAWIAFCKRLQAAAKEAGLNDKFSNQIAGTFVEMSSNVTEHSDCAQSGVAGYKWCPRWFEYVVADNGIGVLSSLRKNPNYSALVDDAEALRTALTDGESRHGKNSGRGQGFRTLILNIASNNSFLRFRSGDHCHTIDGTKSSLRLNKQLGTNFQGFLISIVCLT